MIIIYCDKPHISRTVFKSFQNKFPDKKLVFIHCLYFSNVPFAYPQNIKWQQFPYIQEAKFKINPIERWMATTPNEDSLISIDITMEDIISSEQIIYASEPTYDCTYLFSIFIKLLFNKNVQDMHIESLILKSLAQKDMDTALANTGNFYNLFNDTLNYGKIIKYFDYNFNFNSFALFSRIYKHTQKIFNNSNNLISDENVFFSKYMIQVLYFINNEILEILPGKEPYTYETVIQQMYYWKGTGKYSNNTQLGSPASRSQIINNLIKLKLIHLDSSHGVKNKLYLTEEGKHFLSILPKDCQDQDLPFRIKLWAEQPFDKSKIDTYLNHYFKKIKNKINVLENKVSL